MTVRAPVFEFHIRPLFRLIDREHMLRGLDLWSLEAVWQARLGILERVRQHGGMPPEVIGGPWPNELVTLFERWIATGSNDQPGHHLIGVAPDDGTYELRKIFGGRLRIRTKITVPSDGYRLWFDLESVTPTSRTYRLVAEPPYPEKPGTPREEVVSERMTLANLHRVSIIDAVRVHKFEFNDKS